MLAPEARLLPFFENPMCPDGMMEQSEFYHCNIVFATVVEKGQHVLLIRAYAGMFFKTKQCTTLLCRKDDSCLQGNAAL